MVNPRLKNELKDILKEDYKIVLSTGEVEQIADNLVSYFDLLKKIYHRDKNLSKKEWKKEAAKK